MNLEYPIIWKENILLLRQKKEKKRNKNLQSRNTQCIYSVNRKKKNLPVCRFSEILYGCNSSALKQQICLE